MKKALLIIFIKNPVQGKVKTRLANSTGDFAAFQVYNKLLEHTRNITLYSQIDKYVFYTDFVDKEDIWNNAFYHKYLQIGNDLGEKMQNAFEVGFKDGYDKIILIGTDCYQLTSEIIDYAFAKLDIYDIVLGPANDGGYYLIGMNQLYYPVFQDIHWSTSSVLEETIEKINGIKKSYKLLDEKVDIDTFDDLKKTPELLNWFNDNMLDTE